MPQLFLYNPDRVMDLQRRNDRVFEVGELYAYWGDSDPDRVMVLREFDASDNSRYVYMANEGQILIGLDLTKRLKTIPLEV